MDALEILDGMFEKYDFTDDERMLLEDIRAMLEEEEREFEHENAGVYDGEADYNGEAGEYGEADNEEE